jgi:hypothetical protein
MVHEHRHTIGHGQAANVDDVTIARLAIREERYREPTALQVDHATL